MDYETSIVKRWAMSTIAMVYNGTGKVDEATYGDDKATCENHS